MKKSLIALAVLAASGAAMAQSSVTLYGRLDAGIGQTEKETTGANPVSALKQTQVTTSEYKTTFWGLKGTEDLGGGLKANFKLESTFNLDTGTIGGFGTATQQSLFEREANVGLSGGFGTVTLGRQYTTQFSVFSATDNIGNANVSTGADVWGAGVAKAADRADNAIRYDSPSFGGVSGSIIYALGENKTGTTDATNLAGVSIKYAAGPLMVAYAHQEEDKSNTLTNKYDLLGGTYDFGVAKLNAAYQQTKSGALKDKEYNLGVTVPMGAFGFSAGYSKSEGTGGAAELSSDGFTLAGTYDLSKRTYLYASYYNFDIQKNTAASAATVTPVINAGVDTNTTTFFGVGVVHLF